MKTRLIRLGNLALYWLGLQTGRLLALPIYARAVCRAVKAAWADVLAGDQRK